jgi:two-component system, response regulator, stage 0 sporulation protein F
MQMQVERRRRQVVVADDDADMRSLIAQSLRRAGLEVIEAEDGRALIEVFERAEDAPSGELPDLIITDVHMPGTSGLTALARLAQTHPNVPIIVITAFGDETTHEAARAHGAVAVFDKPFDLYTFCDTVISTLGY